MINIRIKLPFDSQQYSGNSCWEMFQNGTKTIFQYGRGPPTLMFVLKMVIIYIQLNTPLVE